ncbi:MAG TPA: hypothetical protein VMT43_03860 [Acidimicrobiales bacterium]|nr:hypothetical protein [Acidimicrobiales bacterium]
MDRIESGTRLIVYVDPAVPSDDAHARVAAARERLGLEPVDIVFATDDQRRADVDEHDYTHVDEIGPGEPTSRYLGVWMTLPELEVLSD